MKLLIKSVPSGMTVPFGLPAEWRLVKKEGDTRWRRIRESWPVEAAYLLLHASGTPLGSLLPSGSGSTEWDVPGDPGDPLSPPAAVNGGESAPLTSDGSTEPLPIESPLAEPIQAPLSPPNEET
jgi:hypothetical protein